MRLRNLPEQGWLRTNAPPSIASSAIGGALENFSRIKEKIARGKGDPKEAAKSLENVKKQLQKEGKNAKRSKDKQTEKFLAELDSLADQELENLKQKK
jgi:hypothetical protein